MVRWRTDPNDRTPPGPLRHWGTGLPNLWCAQKDLSSLSLERSSRANPPRDGDAKPEDLGIETARPPIQGPTISRKKGDTVKSNLARFTWSLMLLAAMALTVGAGIRWS